MGFTEDDRQDAEGASTESDDMVAGILKHRLRQDDLDGILQRLTGDERADLHRELTAVFRRTSALLEVAGRMSRSLNTDVLLADLGTLISELLDCERCSVFLVDPETRELYTRAAGVEGELRFALGQGIASTVHASGLSINVKEASTDPRFDPEVDRRTGFTTRSILAAPIRPPSGSDGEIIGVIQALNRRQGPFSGSDEELLESLAATAAGPFVNARAYQAVVEERDDDRQLLDLTAAMATELELAPLLRQIMQTAARLLDADKATLFMHDPRTHELWTLSSLDAKMKSIRFPDSKGIAGSVFTTGLATNIEEAYDDPRFNREIDLKTGYRTKTILCIPVRNKKGVSIAVLQVLNKRSRVFTRQDEQRLQAFSAQASIAIENAKLFDEVVRVKNYNQNILQSMTNGVITLDEDGRIVTLNDAAIRIVGLTDRAATVAGRSATDFFAGENEWIAASIATVRQTGKTEVAMDAVLALGLPEERPTDSERPVGSVNMTVVPLVDPKATSIGAMLMIEDLTTEKRLKGTMARYMTKEVADQLLGEGEAALGGKLQTATVLFTDIRSFTTISERIGPHETVKMLNEYFTIMVDVILDKKGVLDKYIGDAIMAVFGVPVASPDDADRAVEAAVGMLRALAEFNARRAAEGQDPVLMGLGINTDQVVSGNIGSLKRMDYTVIGDGVNLASRLEGANKPYGTQLLISELTRGVLTRPFKTREVDRIKVKGKNLPVGIYEVMDHLDEPHLDALLTACNSGLERYRNRDFAGARKCFVDALEARPDDTVSVLYIDRCDHFIADPPAEDWDGVWTMKTK